MSEQSAALSGEVTTSDDTISDSDDNGAALERARAFERHARNVLQPLIGKFEWRTIALFLGILIGVSSVAALTVNGYLSYWVAVPINALLIYFIFTPLHEATHDNILGPYRNLKWLQEAIGHISGMVLLAPYPGFRVLHLHHHNHTNDAVEDPDYWVKSNNYFAVILRCMAIQPAYVIHLYKIARDPLTMRIFVYELLLLGTYIPIIGGAFLLGFGWELVLLWILPGYIGVVMCPLMFDWPVHHPHTKRGRYSDSAVLLFPNSVRWLVDSFFCGHAYHLMHHMYPRLPYYHYGTAYYALESELTGVGAKVRRIAGAR
jgi:beta-carotene hydroxylase